MWAPVWGLLGPAGRWPQRHGASRFGRADPPRLLAGAQRTRGGVRVVVGTRVTRATAPVGLRRLCPCAGVGVGYTGWTRAQPLEIRVSNGPYPNLTRVPHSCAPAQALELGTHVGQTHIRWRSTPRRSPTPVPISNARTHLQRVQAWNSGSIVRGAGFRPVPVSAEGLPAQIRRTVKKCPTDLVIRGMTAQCWSINAQEAP